MAISFSPEAIARAKVEGRKGDLLPLQYAADILLARNDELVPLGSYLVTILGADNPALAPGGRLDLSHVVNVVLLMAYSFTPRS